MSSEPVLEARRLFKAYRSTIALAEIALTVRRSSITALVGPNGAGKSTLLRTWMGFERPTSGVVRVLGLDPIRDRVAALGRVAYVGQTPALYRELTVKDHLELAAHYRRGFDRERAERRLAALSVPLDRPVRTLSGGETAQASLAVALGTRADVILLDEPLASLDPLARADFLSVLADDVRETGATVVMSSHVVGDIERVSDVILVLAHGKVMLDSKLDDVRRSYWVAARAPSDGSQVVATVPDPAGGSWTLIRADRDSVPEAHRANVEHVVLGYLAQARGA